MEAAMQKLKKKDIMKRKSSIKSYDVVSKADDKLSQLRHKKSGVLKRFLDWIARGSKNTCPT
jgi:hypothetical protein